MGRKPNYSFEKKQREKAKADKREAKRQAKLAAKAAAEQPVDDESAPEGSDSVLSDNAGPGDNAEDDSKPG